jgi:hypothetical protein
MISLRDIEKHKGNGNGILTNWKRHFPFVQMYFQNSGSELLQRLSLSNNLKNFSLNRFLPTDPTLLLSKNRDG